MELNKTTGWIYVLNEHMVDKRVVGAGIKTLDELEKKGQISLKVYSALYGICRNYFINTFGYDANYEDYKDEDI